MRRFGQLGLVFLLGVSGLVMAFYPTLLSGFRQLQTDPGDTRLQNYLLEHCHRWLMSPGRLSLFDAPFFYPEPETAAYSDFPLALVPFYSPWRLSGFAPDTAFQLWCLTVAGINFGIAYVFFRSLLGISELPAGFAAFLFAFGSPRLCQLNHFQLLPHFYTLLALLGLGRALEAQRLGPSAWGSISLFFAGLTAQFYGSYYHGWFLCFCLAIAGATALALPDVRPRLRQFFAGHWKPLLAGSAISAATLLPLGTHYLRVARSVGFRTYTESIAMIPRLQSWFFLGTENWLYGAAGRLSIFRQLPMAWEHRLGIGLATSALVLATLVRERARPWIRVLGIGALAVIGLTTLARGGYSAWHLVFATVPGADGIRAVSRVGIMLLFPAAAALGLFLERGLAGPRGWLAAAVGVFCLAEQGQREASFDKQMQRKEVAAVARRISPGCRAFFLSAAGGDWPEYQIQLDAMWASLSSGVPTVNGYSGNSPAEWALSPPRVALPEDESRLEQALSAWARRHGLSRDSICWVKGAPPGA